MNAMTNIKKISSLLLSGVLLMGGCSSSTAESTASASASASAAANAAAPAVGSSLNTNVYQNYAAAVSLIRTADSYSAGVKCSYEMTYSDDSVQTYDLDGVLQVQGISSDPVAHITQNINGNGMESTIEGYYYGGRLYNTYNSVNYYEDMSLSSLEQSMLVPLDVLNVKDSEIATIKAEKADNGTKYTIVLDDSAALSYFNSRYDFNSLKDYSDFKVVSNTITETFSTEGYLVQQTADFDTTLTQDSVDVNVKYSSSVGYLNNDSTTVSISDSDKTAMASYVNYKDIDTDAISDADTSSDAAESTATATFQKRLINRLGYSVDSDGTYNTTFNDTESYKIDFKNYQFIYTNMSSTYTYNWKGDTGGFGTSCNYNFDTDSSTSTCDSDVLTMIKTVKNFFEMELYYCGLSLDELVSEVQ
jgi:hypothetical protein